MEEKTKSSGKAPHRRRYRHHRGNRHRQQHGDHSDQVPSQQVAGVSKSVLVTEPGIEATVELDGSGLQIGVLGGGRAGDDVLQLKGVESHNLHVAQVAVATGLPYAAKQLICAAPEPLDAVVGVGCWLRGDCFSVPAVADAVGNAVMAMSMKTKTPVIYGVLNCISMAQARQCAGLTKKAGSFGVEWARTAITMAWQNREDTKKSAERWTTSSRIGW